MAESALPSRGPRSLLAAACLVIVIAGLKAAAVILVPLALALFVAILSLPLLAFLRRHRVPLTLAVTVTMVCDFALLTLVVLLALGSLSEVSESGPRYAAALGEKLRYTADWWAAKGLRVADWLSVEALQPKALVGILGNTLLRVGNWLSQGVLVLLTIVFLLLEALDIPARLTAASGGRLHPALFARLTLEVQRYLAIKTLMAAVLAGAVAAWAYFMGLDFVLALGLVAFLCHFVPNVGAVLAALPAMALAFVDADFVQALIVGAGYLVLGLVLGSLLEPLLLGRRLRLSTLVVFVSLIFWGWVWGPIGMLLSVPLTLSVKILCEHSEGLGWVAVLLGSEVPESPGAPTAEGTPARADATPPGTPLAARASGARHPEEVVAR